MYSVSLCLAIIIFMVSFIEVKHFWSLKAINYFEAYIHCWLEAIFQLEVSCNFSPIRSSWTHGQRHSSASEWCGISLDVIMKKYVPRTETESPWSSPQSLRFIQAELRIHSWFIIMKCNRLADNFWKSWNSILASCLLVVNRDLHERTQYALIAISLLLYPNSLWMNDIVLI
jgi:hypothetical protein